MNKINYSELHCHSAFSLLDGASTPEELVITAKKTGLSSLALTDHNDLGGLVRFSEAAKELNFPAITGAELTLEDQSHLILLAEDITGYKNLCHLITRARSAARGSPQVSYDILAGHAKGLIALSGCPGGIIPSSLASDNEKKAESHARKFLDIFQDSFFLELWDHHLSQEKLICERLLNISNKYKIPWVVTNNVHYAVPGKRVIHDVLTCLKHEVTLSTAGRRLRPNGSWYIKSPEQMTRLWRHNLEGIKNTQVISERCQFRLGLLKPSLPYFQTPDRSTHNGMLERLVWEGAAKRYPVLTEKHRKQINHELSLITKLDLSAYFLIMHDIVQYAVSQGIAVQGRGSAANSAVCYCLEITAVDPIEMDLLFERFLSEGRNEPPDIDLDIAHQEREKVIQYVYEKYGREHAAMVCETITYRGRSAVRDTARVLGFSQEHIDKLAAESHFREAKEAASALANGGIQHTGLDPKDKRVKLLIKVVAGLDRLPRHRSIHVGGFVLSGEPLGNLVPIEPASMPGRTVIQWDKDDLDPVGMIKIDLLGLGMLTMIQEAVKLVEKHRNLKVDLARLDMNDQSIYKMLSAADTIGIFQVESRAQMNILPKLQPRCFYDIVVSIALVRPGPIQGNIVHPYVRRRRGEEEVVYLHPKLEPILKRTLGVPLFQEQGMRLAVVAAGFSPTEADHLRRVMSHKRSQEKMARLCERLESGMQDNGFSPEAVKTITHQLQAFAHYGFPESHALSFGLLVYASAYLKKYYAPEFYCAILNAQPMGFYSPDVLIRDARRHNVRVHPPDLAASSWDCTLERNNNITSERGHLARFEADGTAPGGSPGAGIECSPGAGTGCNPGAAALPDGALILRLGLRYIQGLGNKAKVALEAAWRDGGSFKSIKDVVKRSRLNSASLRILAESGAFDSFCPDRRQALWNVLAELNNYDNLPLFKHAEESTDADTLPRMSPLDMAVADYKTMGLTTGPHPMTFYRQWANSRRISTCQETANLQNGKLITVAGSIVCRQRPSTAKGFVFLTLEDETGMTNVVVKPKVFESYGRTILNSSFLSVTGVLQIDQGVINVVARHIKALPKAASNLNPPSHDFH